MTTEDWSTSHGQTNFHSLSKLQKMALSHSGSYLCFYKLVQVSFADAALVKCISPFLWFTSWAIVAFPEMHLFWFKNTMMSFTVNINPAMLLWWPKWKVSKVTVEAFIECRSKFHSQLIKCILCVFPFSFCERNDCWLLHHSGWNLPFQNI